MRKIHKALHITHRLLIANRRYTLTITYKYITPYSYYTLRVMGEPTIPEAQQPCILHRSPSLTVMCPLGLWGDDQDRSLPAPPQTQHLSQAHGMVESRGNSPVRSICL